MWPRTLGGKESEQMKPNSQVTISSVVVYCKHIRLKYTLCWYGYADLQGRHSGCAYV